MTTIDCPRLHRCRTGYVDADVSEDSYGDEIRTVSFTVVELRRVRCSEGCRLTIREREEARERAAEEATNRDNWYDV